MSPRGVQPASLGIPFRVYKCPPTTSDVSEVRFNANSCLLLSTSQGTSK